MHIAVKGTLKLSIVLIAETSSWVVGLKIYSKSIVVFKTGIGPTSFIVTITECVYYRLLWSIYSFLM